MSDIQCFLVDPECLLSSLTCDMGAKRWGKKNEMLQTRLKQTSDLSRRHPCTHGARQFLGDDKHTEIGGKIVPRIQIQNT